MSVYGSPSQPDFPSALAQVQHLSQDQLQELLRDESKFDEFIKSLDQMKNLSSEKEMLMASNKSLAEYNLSQEPVLSEARLKLQEKHREAIKSAERVRLLKQEVGGKAGKTEPETLLALLQAAHAETEEESEAIAEEFLNKGDLTVDQFIDAFMEKRKLAHLRRIKIDKMKELLERQRTGSNQSSTPVRRAPPPPGPANYNAPPSAHPVAAPTNNWGAAPAAPYPPQNGSAATASLPYPIHPVGMPGGPGYNT